MAFSYRRTAMRVLFSYRKTLLAVGSILAIFLIDTYFFRKPRILAVEEVPIAFWAWRNSAPTNDDIQKAVAATNAKVLFLRAGQFDLANGVVQRIRPVSGSFRSPGELHLVYNGTSGFLREFERLDHRTLAETIVNTYSADIVRARNDHADITGLQLDLDIPTRLLPEYALLLQRLRGLLPPDTKLSITGLPTWTETDELAPALAVVDFWIPQCYGSKIPTHVVERIPISSPAEVARTMTKVRQFGKQFFAGLSAYGYAILYDSDGSLLELRGDLDPALASRHEALEFVSRETFKGEASEMRYEYRAKDDLVLDGLVIRKGESLVFDLPSSDSLRASARAARENAGEMLLGICLFRLPTTGDAATLSVTEIAAALSDKPLTVVTQIKVVETPDKELRLLAENIGTTGGDLSENAVTIDLDVPSGSIAGVTSVAGFSEYETLCGELKSANPCSEKRANVIRLRAAVWPPRSTAAVSLRTSKPVPDTLSVLIATRVGDGQIEEQLINLTMEERLK